MPHGHGTRGEQGTQRSSRTSLRSDIGGERMPLALPAIADSEDMLTADRLAALAPGEPSRKKAEGEKLPGVKPECTARAHTQLCFVTLHVARGRQNVVSAGDAKCGWCAAVKWHKEPSLPPSRQPHTPLPQSTPCSATGVPPAFKPRNDAERRRLSWPGEELTLLLVFFRADMVLDRPPKTDLNAHEPEGVPAF